MVGPYQGSSWVCSDSARNQRNEECSGTPRSGSGYTKLTPEEDNARFLELAQKYHANYMLIDDKYDINIHW